ncbi:DMT family transporter [Beijerinckia sp. L45]|uniref:DMT family transporter n=1 Tax=Beijerinckia sp. L45 TaxID=1641855 RepID=UPI00131DAB8F|nr:DMT family transporter [Beijerinckia sp. L45]
MTESRAAKFIPWLFVLLWASGFIVARLVRPYAEPESFVSLRFALSAVVLFVIATIGGAHWPRTARGWINGLIAGALMQGVYVGSVFWSVKNGLPPALAALISGLQPLLTGMLATPLLGERVGRTRWIGIAIGFAGAVLVIAPNLSGTTAVPPIAVAACTFGMVGITLGTIWQKRIGGLADLRSGASLQFVGGLLVTVPLMLATEHGHVGNNINVWAGLAWAVLGLSVVTTMLLLWLIKGGAVAKIASLFYLVPPVTALMAFVLFGEALAPIQFVGMAVAAAGVAIANRG